MERTSDGKDAVQNEHNSGKTLQRWLKTHRLVITLISSLTVLAGFVINEGLDEPVKDTLGSITAAEQAVNHASENVGLFWQLTGIATNLSLVRTRVIDQKPVDAQTTQLAALQAAHTQTLALIGANITALHVQMSVLPRSFREEEATFEGDYQKLFFASGSINQASMDELMHFSNDWSVMADRSRMLVGKGTRKMEDIRAKSERLHKIYFLLTYFFFILGWVVGLVSNIAGESGSTAADIA